MRRLIQSFQLAFQNIRSNLFHTFLSVLGVVIGVGALVSILSLIDGMQDFAQEQIASTTSLNMVSVYSETHKRSNGISIKKDSVTVLEYQHFVEMQKSLTKPFAGYLFQRTGREIHLDSDTTRVAVYTTGVNALRADSILFGRSLTQADLDEQKNVCVITEALAKALVGKSEIKSILEREIISGEGELTIVGIATLPSAKGTELFFPVTLLTLADLKANPPQCVIAAKNVQDVPSLKSEIENYLTMHFKPSHDFKVSTNEFRVEQAAKGFLLFKIIMGLIVGISVVVGGIGVMNVLLISVTQRTTEIGIRKAMGANRRDIILLFLSESVAVSAFGSLVGLIFGTLFTMAAVPIVTKVTEVPFYASYTWNTFLLISIIAVLVGVIFGTYPAIRASRLNPVDAIRHE